MVVRRTDARLEQAFNTTSAADREAASGLLTELSVQIGSMEALARDREQSEKLYREETGKCAIQLLTDKDLWCIPAYPGEWVQDTIDDTVVPEETESLVPPELRNRQISRWKSYGPPNPHPIGHISNPNNSPTDTMDPSVYSFWRGNPHRHMLFFIDPQNDDPTQNSLRNGLRVCFFDHGDRDVKLEWSIYILRNVRWDKEATIKGLANLLVASLAGGHPVHASDRIESDKEGGKHEPKVTQGQGAQQEQDTEHEDTGDHELALAMQPGGDQRQKGSEVSTDHDALSEFMRAYRRKFLDEMRSSHP